MEKLELKYEENKDGYSLEIKGTVEKNKLKKEPETIFDEQTKIIFKILMNLYEQKEKLKLNTPYKPKTK